MFLPFKLEIVGPILIFCIKNTIVYKNDDFRHTMETYMQKKEHCTKLLLSETAYCTQKRQFLFKFYVKTQ